MRLMLATDDGTVLDSEEVTLEEWQEAQSSSVAALALIGGMHPGTVD